MEMVVGLFAGGSAAAAGTAAATTATTAAAVGGTSTALSVLQGFSTAFTVLSSLSAGAASARQANTQAELETLRGRQEANASEEKALNIRRQMLKTIGANRVAFAASGVDVGSGSSEAMEQSIENDAAYATRIEKNNAELRLLQSRLRSTSYRDQADAATTKGMLTAAGAVADFGVDIAKRG